MENKTGRIIILICGYIVGIGLVTSEYDIDDISFVFILGVSILVMSLFLTIKTVKK